MTEISAVLIVRNEAACLQACLQALRLVVDEIVVADTGSTDETLSIAETIADRCVSIPWQDDFAAARNAALAHATGAYVFQVDADEIVDEPQQARERLLQFIKTHEKSVVGTVEIVNRVGVGQDMQQVVDHTDRFFCRAQAHYAGAIHEQIVVTSGEKQRASTGVRLQHSGYAQAPDSPDHKAHRNIRILRKELAAHPDDEYCWYQLGKAYFSLGKYARAITALERAQAAIHFSQDAAPQGRLGVVSRKVLTDLVVTLAYAYVNVNRLDTAKLLLEQHATWAHAGVHRADFAHVQGYVALMGGEIEAAQAAFQRALQLGAQKEDVQGTGSYASIYHLGLLSEAEQHLPEALGCYLHSLTMKPDYEAALSRCIDLILEKSIVLPSEIWQAADTKVFTRLFEARLENCLQEGNMEQAKRLMQVAGTLSQELLGTCRRKVQAFVNALEKNSSK